MIEVEAQRGRGTNSSANLPVPTATYMRVSIIERRMNAAIAIRRISVSRVSPNRVRFHSAAVMTPERRMYFAW